jgi:hypothetical protein
MKKIFIIIGFFISLSTNAQKKNWVDNYWLSTNVSLLFSNEKRGTGMSIDAGRNFKYGIKVGLGYSFLQFDADKKADILNAYFEKSIDAEKRSLFFFAKPGIAIANKPKKQAEKISYFEYESAKTGLNLQLGSGIRWKIKRHSYFLSAGYNISQYSLITKESIKFINPINPDLIETVYHTYKWNYNKILVNIGFTL